MMTMMNIIIIILIVSGSATVGFVLSEQQSTAYIVTDLDLTTHAPYAYESSYAVDMGFEEPFGVRSFEIIPDAMGHPIINGSKIKHPHGEDSIVHFPNSSEVEQSQFIIILIGSIVIIMAITLTMMFSGDIVRLIKKQVQ